MSREFHVPPASQMMYALALEVIDVNMGWGWFATLFGGANADTDAVIEQWRQNHVISPVMYRPDDGYPVAWLVLCSCSEAFRGADAKEATEQAQMHRAGVLGP